MWGAHSGHCKIHHMMFKRKGGGVKGFLNNVKKTALFLRDVLPNQYFTIQTSDFILSNDKLYISMFTRCSPMFSECSQDVFKMLSGFRIFRKPAPTNIFTP